MGSAAEALGLSGSVSREDHIRTRMGQDPRMEESLVQGGRKGAALRLGPDLFRSEEHVHRVGHQGRCDPKRDRVRPGPRHEGVGVPGGEGPGLLSAFGDPPEQEEEFPKRRWGRPKPRSGKRVFPAFFR